MGWGVGEVGVWVWVCVLVWVGEERRRQKEQWWSQMQELDKTQRQERKRVLSGEWSGHPGRVQEEKKLASASVRHGGGSDKGGD